MKLLTKIAIIALIIAGIISIYLIFGGQLMQEALSQGATGSGGFGGGAA